MFDAQGAPPGLPNTESYRGITVLFSKGYAEADDLLEELIASDHAPRQLLVVSSDHRLHRAARRRKATPIDSDVWIAQFESPGGRPAGRSPASKPSPSPEQTDSWLAEFADINIDEIRSEIHADEPPSPEGRSESGGAQKTPGGEPEIAGGTAKDGVDLSDPARPDFAFPEDYGQDMPCVTLWDKAPSKPHGGYTPILTGD